ncbi:MAG: WD40 repeat domain-containing protein [Prosthecobacter sp.]|nr:WD40 repeat domain-containing protein [Prosthecobacter sp.]
MAVRSSSFCTLHLLDAETGQEESRTTLPGSKSHFPSSRSIIAIGSGFVVLTKQDLEASILYYVRLDPFAADPTPFQQLTLGGYDHMLVSKNEKYLVLFGTRGYEALSFQKSGWQSCLADQVLDIWSQDNRFLKAAALSPDSRLLFVATSSESKVIDLEAQKLVMDLGTGADGASFSPDGNILLAGEHSGLAAWETQNWTRQPVNEMQHDCPVIRVCFLPDGKNLISHDHNGFIIWDLDSRKPRAFLKGSRGEGLSNFTHFAFANQGSDIIAGDGWDYFQWRLPDLQKPVPAMPEQITATRAFGDLANQSEKCSRQEIYADSTGQHFITVNDQGVQWRDIAAPNRIKTLSSIRKVRFGAEAHAMFLDEGKLCLHDYDDKMHHVDISSDQLTTVVEHKDVWAQGLWLPGRRCYVAIAREGIQFIDAQTGGVIQTLVKPKGSATTKDMRFQNVFCIAVSKDEKTAAVYMQTIGAGDESLTLWDIDSGELLAIQPLQDLDINCIDFSQDGKTIAIGHKNTAISLWDVGLILENKPQEGEESPAVGTRRKPSYRLMLTSSLPQQSLLDLQGNQWTFATDGSLGMDSRLPSFGTLKVNGKPFVNKGSLYFKRDGDEKVAEPFSIHNVGEIEGGEVWVDRTLALPRLAGVYKKTVLQAVDGFTNVTGENLKAEISFQVRFPADSQGLLSSADQRVNIPSDGRFSITGEDQWIAAAGSGKAGEPLAAIRIHGWVRAFTPELHWNAEQKLLTATYNVDIPAGETRWLVHGVGFVNRFAEGSIDAVEPFPMHADIGHYVPPGNRLQGINFGIPDLWNPEHRTGPFPSFMSWSSADPKPSPESDSLGFGWETQSDHSRLGELGATSVFQVWIDGHPTGSINLNSLLHSHVNGKLVIPPTVSLGDLPSGIRLTRRDSVMKGGAATVWYDRFYNANEEAKTARVSYVTTFKSPVLEVWDATGKKHDPAKLTGFATGLGGACAFVLEGNQQPATLLVFSKDGSPLVPSIRWMGPQAVVLDYELNLESKKPVYLIHGACQRPLKAFGGPSGAFTDWLPLTLEPQPLAPGDSPPPVLNYQINSQP